jgi:hypothetical protein
MIVVESLGSARAIAAGWVKRCAVASAWQIGQPPGGE